MQIVSVNLKERSYPIYIGNNILTKSGTLVKDLSPSSRVVLISSSKILGLYEDRLLKVLSEAGLTIDKIRFREGETNKTLATVEKIYRGLVRYRVDRQTLIIALGGGVIGDTVGFAAATYLRGVPYVQIPTTLLAQIDSSIGGKTGVNLQEGKNLVGAFYQPRAVIVDPALLATLPRREFLSGMYEAVKYGVIRNADLFQLIKQKHRAVSDKDKSSLEKIIAECIRIKADIVSRDERESELRMILNFGHTIGHALESVTNYRRFTHGEAIGHGMIMATRLATALRLIGSREAGEIQGTITAISKLPSVGFLKWNDVFKHMLADKKIVEARLRFVLPVKIGQVTIVHDTPRRAVLKVLRSYLTESHA